VAIVNLPNIGNGSDPATINVSVLNGKVDPLATDYNGNIQNVNIAAAAGIVYSKLSLTDGIVNADINSAAAIVSSKLVLTAVTQLATAVVTLTDGATPALNAALGGTFLLTAAGNRTIGIPTNPVSGQKIVIAHLASGADRTLALNTGTGGFRFGTDIASLTATTSSKTDYIGAIYSAASDKWDVVAYIKGF